jgi:ATP-dependent DNA helicase RecG
MKSERIKESVIEVKGVGEERALDLMQLGIRTVEDLLFYFPYRYDDRRIQDLENAKHDEQVTIEGIIHSEPVVRFYGRKKSRLSIKVLVDRFLVTAVLFNRHYAKSHFVIGKKIRLSGKLDKNRMHLAVQDYTLVNEYGPLNQDRLLPIYSVTGSVSVQYMRKIVQQAFKQFAAYIPEIIPAALMKKYKLMARSEAAQVIHAPEDYEAGQWAKRRMVFEEFFLFQLKMQALKRIRRENQLGMVQKIKDQKVNSFISRLPFTLTDAQRNVLLEILKDMKSHYAMNRLLQGDVGSGKTIVAAIALYASYTAGFQGALMVPTEILAEQHFSSLVKIFEGEQMSIAQLTGSSKASERRDVLAGLQMGTVDILVGTHALIQEGVYFKNLGLVITDEQHRFGVEQRRKLRQKGISPDVLFMTATPIPRTLAITAYGDMDVSVIDELPAGRKPIETYWAKNDMFDRIIQFMQKELSKGRQAYFICPLIEESEKLDLENAIDLHSKLTQLLPQFNIGLMHGRLATSEKEEVMKSFSQNDIHVLVSTTVVEVGVNVPNATLMIIQDAERFGLSQLHQLRGRVGRGSDQSYCILIADPKTQVGKERMSIMQQTNDGFEVAKKDLELRGPGDFFGKKQSGLPEFKLADMIHDYKILEVARKDATELIEGDAFWSDGIYSDLRDYLKEQGVIESEKLD